MFCLICFQNYIKIIHSSRHLGLDELLLSIFVKQENTISVQCSLEMLPILK